MSVTQIGWVKVGGFVARSTSRYADVYQVSRITDRWIHLTPLDTDDDATRSVSVAAWRSLTPVLDTDPRVMFPCGL